ncbi:hypothetical protein OMW55_00540 [Sphingomonas sp. BN140010]|uniref:Uncharacterized protein n=1 Tax=Sphingomonas arvum TaxID=2992113 RepID=A0ABT3JB58_9SPHN|nr:hypothetical protein [Sphingomonas sp. BN140010]MCW3796298.1 hypothetical protein [Sphingomonas sp. BN140010]
MNSYLLGLLAGLAVGVTIAVIIKWRDRRRPMTTVERADQLSQRRARMLPALAVVFLTQQAMFFSQMPGAEHAPVERVKMSAWLVLSLVLLAALATKSFWLEPRAVRDLMEDENTQANRNEAMRWGFLFAMGTAVAVYVLGMFEPVTGREAVHIIMTFGIATALLRWGVLERRAHAHG